MHAHKVAELVLGIRHGDRTTPTVAKETVTRPVLRSTRTEEHYQRSGVNFQVFSVFSSSTR